MNASKEITTMIYSDDLVPTFQPTDICSGNFFKHLPLPLPCNLSLIWNLSSQEYSFLLHDQVLRSNHQHITDKTIEPAFKVTEKQEKEDLSLNSSCDFVRTSSEKQGNYISLTLSYARFGDRGKFDEMLQIMIKEGDNVGEDEYSDKDIEIMWFRSEVLVLKDHENIKAFIFLHPCLTSRTFDTCQVSPVFVYDTEWINSISSHISPSLSSSISEIKESFYLALVNFSVQITNKLQLGYTDCVLRVSPDSNFGRVEKLVNKGGFKKVLDIPKSVLIKGNLVRDLVLVKNFAPLRNPRSNEEMTNEINRLYPPSICDSIFSSATLHTFTSLPKIYLLPNNRMLFIRNFIKEDTSWLFDLLMTASENGTGYGLYEFPTLSLFKIFVMLKTPCIISHLMLKQKSYKLKDGSEISHQMLMSSLKNSNILEALDISKHPKIAGCIVSDTSQVRSSSVKVGEGHIILHKNSRNEKLGKELLQLLNAMLSELKFSLMIFDTLTINLTMKKVLKSESEEGRTISLGTMPNVCYINETGWVGSDIQLHQLKQYPPGSLCKLIDSNNNKHKVIGFTSKY